MHMSRDIRPMSLDQYMRRGRQLRSAAAIAIITAFGRAVLRAVERAFVRQHRMIGTPGCGCEA